MSMSEKVAMYHYANDGPEQVELVSSRDIVSRIKELVRDGETVRIQTTYHGEYLEFRQVRINEDQISINVEISGGNGIYVVMRLLEDGDMKIIQYTDPDPELTLWMAESYEALEIGLRTINTEEEK